MTNWIPVFLHEAEKRTEFSNELDLEEVTFIFAFICSKHVSELLKDVVFSLKWHQCLTEEQRSECSGSFQARSLSQETNQKRIEKNRSRSRSRGKSESKSYDRANKEVCRHFLFQERGKPRDFFHSI